MGGTFLDFMKSMGIFILCAQSFLHFTAGKVYEKYVKLLIGVMILAQFVVPVRALFLGRENAWMWEEIERFQAELEDIMEKAGQDAAASMEQDMQEAGTGREKAALEAEIKERLAETAGSHGVSVEEVEFKENPPRLIVTVSGETPETGGIKVEKIIIGQGKGQDIEDMPEGRRGMREELSGAFARALGTDADYVEVVWKY